MTYVIDGGPGTGKTSILKELGKQGHTIIREAARPLIAQEQRRQEANPNYSPVLPWTDFMGFQHAVANATIGRLGRTDQKDVFSDRHLPSQLGYASLANAQVPSMFYDLIAKHPIDTVFIPERIPYVNDGQRTEDQAQAQALHEAVIGAYESIGAHIVHVPVLQRETVQESIAARAAYVLEHVNRPAPDTELEHKYAANHTDVRAALMQYHTVLDWAGKEETWVAPNENGYERVRQRGPEVTRAIKYWTGPDMRRELTVDANAPPEALAKQLGATHHYTNHTEEYRFIGDANTSISLDNIVGVGEFVEIESSSLERILEVKEMLGITGTPVNESYWRMQRVA